MRDAYVINMHLILTFKIERRYKYRYSLNQFGSFNKSTKFETKILI